MVAVEKENAICAKKDADEIQKKIDDDLRIKATGIINLFEDIRDEGIVKYSSSPEFEEKESNPSGKKVVVGVKVRDYTPASILIDEDGAKMIFNHCDINSTDYEYDIIEVYFENNLLIVQGREKMIVGENLSMSEAVGKALADPGSGGYHYQDLGWD